MLPKVLPLASAGAWLVALVKPQFEVGPAAVTKGLVKDPAARERAVEQVRGVVATGRLDERCRYPLADRRWRRQLRVPARGAARVSTRVTIERLGAKGEGLARMPQGQLAVPYTLPGEIVTVDAEGERGTLIGLVEPSPRRIAPICPYFGHCGGCALQMMEAEHYAGWKRGLLVEALARAGVAAPVAPLHDAHGAGRRRVTLHARRLDDGRMQVGFMQAHSHAIVAIDRCPVLDPALDGTIAAACAVAKVLAPLGKPLDILVTGTRTGLDVDLRGAGKLGEGERQALVGAAMAHDLARLSNHGVIVVEQRRPVLSMGQAVLELPPGAFLQATAAGEEALGARVVAALPGAKRIADLFAGVGTFALRLAGSADVTAFDTEAGALQALAKASRAAPASRAVRTEKRDLFGQPLRPDELAAFDAVVLDPPRAGAEAQVRALASSGVPLVAFVACDARNFARDAAILIAGGYRTDRVEPLDQFRYSAHMEIFSLFRRDAPKKKRRLLG